MKKTAYTVIALVLALIVLPLLAFEAAPALRGGRRRRVQGLGFAR